MVFNVNGENKKQNNNHLSFNYLSCNNNSSKKTTQTFLLFYS